MLRTFTVFALVLATAGPATAQSAASQPRPCPVAPMTLLGAAVGFGAGGSIGFGLNVFEDTVDGELKAWMTVVGLTVVGAIIGNDLARRACAAKSSSPSRSPAVAPTEAELQRLSRTVRLPPAREPPGSGNPSSNLTVRVTDAEVERLLAAITTHHPSPAMKDADSRWSAGY